MRFFRKKRKVIGDLKYTSISGKKAYKGFIKNKPKDFEGYIHFYKNYTTIVNAFFKNLADKIIESDRGVFIEGLGYFGVCLHPTKRTTSKAFTNEGLTELQNLKTDGMVYTIAFVPINKTDSLKNWVMDYTFNNKIKHKLSKKLKAGKKYMFIPSFYINQYSSKK